MRRIAVVVYVNTDEIPASQFHTEDGMVAGIQAILDGRISHYAPRVCLAPPNMQMPHGPDVTKA